MGFRVMDSLHGSGVSQIFVSLRFVFWFFLERDFLCHGEREKANEEKNSNIREIQHLLEERERYVYSMDSG